MRICNNCNTKLIKWGSTSAGKQRMRCDHCKKTYTLNPTKSRYSDDDKRYLVDKARRLGFNFTAKTFHVSKTSLINRDKAFKSNYKRCVLIR